MKTILTLLTLGITSWYVQAQSVEDFGDKNIRFQGQIGFDATTFLKQFVVLNNTAPATVSPFNFNGKFLMGKRSHPALLFGPRVGVGYASTHEYSNNEDQSNERSDDSKTKALRVGLELQHRLSWRWSLYYGIDYLNQNSNQATVTTSSGFPGSVRTEIVTNDKTTGFGPIMGVQFNINKWMCLGTEMAFYSLNSKGGTKITSSNPNNTTPETFTDSKNTQIVLPFFVNFNIVF
jgi:hypothetical protein